MNKVIIQGRLTKDVEMRQKDNYVIALFTLAVDRKYARQGEERQTDFFNIVAYGKTAEFINKYFSKGQLVLISGRIENRTWEDKDGNKRITTEIICEETYFAEGRRKQENETNDSSQSNELENVQIDSSDDDLPF